MAEYLIQDTTLSEIADAIRGKNGTTDPIAVTDMAAQIEAITTGTTETVLEGMEIELDMAEGDQALTVPEGYLVKSAILKKPETLIPENIASGVDIGGVVGTLESGTGGSVEGVHYVTFLSENGKTQLYKRPVADGDDCADPVARGLIETPTKDSSARYDYTFSGWATSSYGDASSKALSAITQDKTVYAAFASSTRYYTIRFFDEETLLQTIYAQYAAVPTPDTPTKEGYDFVSWSPTIASATKDADYYAQWTPWVGVQTCTWAEIAEYAEAGTADSTFNIGEKKTITLTYSDGTTEDVPVEIIGFNHDDKSDGTGKAGITFRSYLLATKRQMNSTATNEGGWAASELRSWCNGELLSAIPADLQSVIKEVNKNYTGGKSDPSLQTSADKIWLLCEEETNNLSMALQYNNYIEGQGSVYEAYADLTADASRLVSYADGSASSSQWWGRSANTGYTDAFTFPGHKSYGGRQLATTASLIAFCFCV